MYLVPNMSAQTAETINRRAVLVLLGLCFVAGHAGGLGLVPLAILAGLFGLITSDISHIKTTLPNILRARWIVALALFLGWGLITTLWSPYESKGVSSIIKLSIGVIFFEAGRRAIVRAAGEGGGNSANSLQKLFLFLPIIAAVLMCLDTASGFGLSFAVDPPKDSENIDRRIADAIMNTSKGVVFLILMSAPAVMLMLRVKYRGPITAVILLTLIAVSGVLSGLNVAIAALAMSVAAMALAAFYPKFILNALTAGAMVLVGFAPVLSALAAASSTSFRAALPFSWEHRVVTWSYVGERIREHPIIGHGFDASRTFDATFDARGFEGLSVVSLHPHNAGLHIWLETGVIGALLATAFLWLLGREAIKFAQGGRARAMAVAGLIAPVVLISSVSYGVWQEWWWATLFISAGVLILVPKTKVTFDNG